MEPSNGTEALDTAVSTNPIVSVIMPVFNKAADLKQAVQSALSQTLRDIEIVIVDDGSTDDSVSVAHALARSDSRVVVMTQANAGVAAARNHGLARATGEFVAFLDPDDWYPDEEVLRDLVNAAESWAVPIAGGSAEKFVQGKLSRQYPAAEAGYVFDTDGIVEYADYQFDYGFWRFIYRRKFLIDNGIFFAPYRRYQDPPFFVLAMSLAGQFVALRRSTYVYRVATSTNWTPERVVDVIRGMIDVLRVASEFGHRDLAARTIRRFNAAHIQAALHTALEQDAERVLPLLETLALVGAQTGSIWQAATPPAGVVATRTDEASGPIDVSVIVPVYNAAAWLHECLLSVLGQTGVSIEIICVNDGSSDDSMRILRDYQAIDPARVRIIEQENGGLSVARNTGIDAARGRYLCFLDSDDYWRSDGLSALVARADLEQLDVLQFDAVPFADPGVPEADWKRYSTYYDRTPQRTDAITGVQLVVGQIEASDYKPSACLYLIRRGHLEKHGIRFVPGMTHEDNPFTFAVFLNAQRAAHMAQPIYARRVRASSIMTGSSQEASMRGYFISYVLMLEQAERHTDDIETSRVLGTQLFRTFNNIHARTLKVDTEALHRLEELVTTPAAQIAYSALMKLLSQSQQLATLRKK